MNIENLNQRRKKLNLSIDELAQKANLPKSTVEKILFGIVKHPRIDTIQAIEKALEITNSTTETSISQKNTSLTKKQSQLLTAFDQLIPELQDYIIETTEKLLAKMQENKKYNKGNAHGNF